MRVQTLLHRVLAVAIPNWLDSLILFSDERMLNLGRAASFGSAQSFGRMQRLPDACGMLSATPQREFEEEKDRWSGQSVGRAEVFPSVLRGS